MNNNYFDINAFIKPYLPLDNKRKIDDIVRQIQLLQIPVSKKLDGLICKNIADEDLRFYYDCISPKKPHNLSFTRPLKKKRKRKFLGGITHTTTKVKNKGKSIIKGFKKNNESHNILVNPNSSEYNSQIMKANLKDKYKEYEYGLSDW